MKIGLDFHGVIDTMSEFLSELSGLLVSNGHEVHVITGEEDSKKLREKLQALQISYTHLFSIASYHKSIGTNMWYDDKDTPWLNDELWDKTKAVYCAKHEIDLHLDDSDIYCKHFMTPYAQIKRGIQ